MPNSYANRITIEGENVKETILSLLTFDELGDEADFDFNKVIKMPKTVNDRVEWAKKHWGCKDNPLYTSVDMEQGRIDFETPWCPCLPVVEKLAELHPELTITYEYSSDEAGYNVGKFIYMYGHLKVVVDIESYTKEAYEQYFELFGKDNLFEYSEEKGTYIFKS